MSMSGKPECLKNDPIYFRFQDQALESSRESRAKEWDAFMTDIQDKCARIDDAYKQKEVDLSRQFQALEKQLQTPSPEQKQAADGRAE